MSIETTIQQAATLLPAKGLSRETFGILRRLIEVDLVTQIRELVYCSPFVIEGHVGQGTIADVPWVGLHDSRVNSNPQTGIYIALLFAVDGKSVALSIQHGTEKLRVEEVEEVARELRPFFPPPAQGFCQENLSLVPANPQRQFTRPKKYETASLVGKKFDIPFTDVAFVRDLRAITSCYLSWVEQVVTDEREFFQLAIAEEQQNEEVEPFPGSRLERAQVRRAALHPPRSSVMASHALLQAAGRCESDPEHETFVKRGGGFYLENHHLIPLEHYFAFDRSIDHFVNIYCLCPTCHRKIHHARHEDRVKLIADLFRQREVDLMKYYNVSLEQLLALYGIRIKSRRAQVVGEAEPVS